MRGAGFLSAVAVLASGCLDAPPSAVIGAGDGGSEEADAAPGGGIEFPPAGAAVRITAALAADVDQDGREDLILLDDEVSDDWAGVYILRGKAAGWSALDEVKLDLRPTAAHWGRLVKPSGAALVVGGAQGKFLVVEHIPGQPYRVDELAFDTEPTGRISIVHTGIASPPDTTASLITSDGITLWQTTPIEIGATLTLSTVDTGELLSAGFWPPVATDPTLFVAARTRSEIRWYRPGKETGLVAAPAQAARFASIEPSLCGTHLALGNDASLEAGWVACDGSGAASDPVVGPDLASIAVMTAGDLGGGALHDVALVGFDGDDPVVQVLIDLAYDVGGGGQFLSTVATAPAPLAGLTAGNLFLTPVDVQMDGSSLLFAVAETGAITCVDAAELEILPCPPGWQVTAP